MERAEAMVDRAPSSLKNRASVTRKGMLLSENSSTDTKAVSTSWEMHSAPLSSGRVSLRVANTSIALNTAMSQAQNRSDPWRPAHRPASLYSHASGLVEFERLSSTYWMELSPVKKHHTSTAQHTVSAAAVSTAATRPPQARVSARSKERFLCSRWATPRHRMEMTQPAKATSSPRSPIIDMA